MTWILCFSVLLFAGCQQAPRERQYTEKVEQVPAPLASLREMPQTADDPHAGLDMTAVAMSGMDAAGGDNAFSWQLPEGWTQEPGQGFRMASFHLSAQPKAIDCSIVRLAGPAGGLEANLSRWMGQIGIKASPGELSALIAAAGSLKIKSGQEGTIYDFTALTQRGGAAKKSMVVVMVRFSDATLFVKMTGGLSAVSKNKETFLKFARSIEPKAGGSISAAGGNMADPHTGMDMSNMPAGMDMAAGMGADPHAGLNMRDPHEGMDLTALAADMPAAPQILDWDIPPGWQLGGAHPMRLATFQAAVDAKPFDCAVIVLSGGAGGVEANLRRWIAQIGISPTAENLNAVVKGAAAVKTKDGMEGKVYDLTLLQANDLPSSKSMMAAMLSAGNSTVFVKINGSLGTIREEKRRFMDLAASLRRK